MTLTPDVEVHLDEERSVAVGFDLDGHGGIVTHRSGDVVAAQVDLTEPADACKITTVESLLHLVGARHGRDWKHKQYQSQKLSYRFFEIAKSILIIIISDF